MKRKLTGWALWNYDTLQTVELTRKRCREYANNLVVGGKEKADEYFKAGSFDITKVVVREL